MKKLFEILVLSFGIFASLAILGSFGYAVLERQIELERESATRVYEISIGNVMNRQMATLRVYRAMIADLNRQLEAEKSK